MRIQPIASEVENTYLEFGNYWLNVERRPKNYSLEVVPTTKKPATMAPFKAVKARIRARRAGLRWWEAGVLLFAGYVGLLYASCAAVEIVIFGSVL